MKHRRILAGALASALVLVLLAACGDTSGGSSSQTGGSTSGSVPESASQSQSQESASSGGSTSGSETASGSGTVSGGEADTIRFCQPAGQIRTAIELLAQDLGYYEEEGVTVEYVNSSGTDALTAITTGNSDVDVLGTGIVPDLTFIANGSDLVVFAGTAAEGGCIISKPEDVETYRDLKNYEGITAALVRGDTAWLVTRAQLLKQGIDLDSIQLMEVDSQASVCQAVAKGEAAVGFLPVQYATSMRDIGIELVMETGELEPNYVCCRQVTSSSKLEEKHDAFVRFTIANLRAWEYYEDEANRDSIVKFLAEYSGQDEDYVRSYLFQYRTKLTLDPNQQGVTAFYETLGDSGYFDASAVDISEHIDTSVYEEALQAVLDRYPDDPFFQDKLELYREYNDAQI